MADANLQEFWKYILQALSTVTSHFDATQPPTGRYVTGLVNGAGFHLCGGTRLCRAELYLKSGRANEIYRRLDADRQAIEARFGARLVGELLLDQPNARIKTEVSGNARDQADLPMLRDFYVSAVPRLIEAFRPDLERLAPEFGGRLALR